MKALIKKDSYSLLKQMKIYFFMILFFSCLPGYPTTAFAVVYAAMLPITAIAYDERCKWPSLAIMMPYSPTEQVLSKFVIGYIGMIATVVVSMIAGAVTAVIKNTPITGEIFYANIGVLLVGCLAIAIIMPIMFRFGVEKGRIVMIIIVAVVVGAITAIAKILDNQTFTINVAPQLLLLVGIILIVIITYASIMISKNAYIKKNFG